MLSIWQILLPTSLPPSENCAKRNTPKSFRRLREREGEREREREREGGREREREKVREIETYQEKVRV